MKKVFPILVILFVFTLIIQYVVNFIITEHEVEYSVRTADNSYYIKESFRSINDESFYDFTVRDKNDSFFIFSFNEDLNRQEEVIKDIKFFTTKDLQCIFPIYKRKKTGNLSCIYNGNLVSYSYLEQINNYDISLMTNKLKQMGYDHADWNNTLGGKTEPVDEAPSIKVYQKNIPDDYYFTMWNYKGIVIMNDTNSSYRMYLNTDYYNNINAALVGKYYVHQENLKDDFNYFLMYNVRDYGKGVINTESGVVISNNYYFNGVYKNKLYVTDLEYKQQFEVNPVTEKAKVVGSEKDGFYKLKDNKLVSVKADEFLSARVYFDSRISNKILEKGGIKRFL